MSGECCNTDSSNQRRPFWVTQADACGLTWDKCALQNCGKAGFRIISSQDSAGATIATNNWVAGLILNILLTRGTNTETSCGIKPGQRGGHWSDSFTGNSSGSRLQNLEINNSPRIAIPLVKSAIEFDLQKLISWGLCDRVEAVVQYTGSGAYKVAINAFGPGGDSITGLTLSGSAQNNLWRWGQ